MPRFQHVKRLEHADDGRGTAHVVFHFVHRTAGFQRNAAGIERDALADERDRLAALGRAVVFQDDHLRGFDGARGDGQQRAHAEFAHVGFTEHFDARSDLLPRARARAVLARSLGVQWLAGRLPSSRDVFMPWPIASPCLTPLRACVACAGLTARPIDFWAIGCGGSPDLVVAVAVGAVMPDFRRDAGTPVGSAPRTGSALRKQAASGWLVLRSTPNATCRALRYCLPSNLSLSPQPTAVSGRR